MIKAVATSKDGRHVLLLGLSAVNVDRLQHGEPIYFDLKQLRLTDGDALGHITLFYAPTEADLRKAITPLIGPSTVVFDVPQGSDEPQ